MIRFAAFLLSAAAWYGLLLIPMFWGEDIHRHPEIGGVALLFGIAYGIPTMIYAIIADGLAAVFFPKSPALGFIVFALLGIVGFFVMIELGPGAPENKAGIFPGLFQIIGLPWLSVIVIYTLANVLRSRRVQRNEQAPIAPVKSA
jgi:hypothetical protein